MKKRKFWKLAVFLLAAVLISVILFQWKSFSSEQTVHQYQINTEISIQHNKNQFNIKQRINHLPSNTFEISWPKDAINRKCVTNTNKKCSWLDNQKTILKNSNSEVTFSYTLNRRINDATYILNNWFVSFHQMKMGSVKINLTESESLTGTWIMGGKNVAVKHLAYIEYYVFEGNGDISSLLWVNRKLTKQELDDRITIFHNDNINDPLISLNRINRIKNIPFLSVYVTNDVRSQTLGKLMIINIKDLKSIEDIVINAIINEKYRFPSKEEWFKDIIASSVSKKPIGSIKAQKMYQQLLNTLDPVEFDKWTSEIRNLNEKMLSDKELDLLLQKITGLQTEFFHQNKNENEPLISLAFIESRKIIIHGHEIKDLDIVFRNGKRYYPFEKTMTEFGYHFQSNENKTKMIIEKPNSQYQFDLNSHIFIYNHEKYGVLSSPIINWNDHYYIEENWLKSLFKIKIKENPNTIELGN